jgi:hypothetical protein
VRDLFRREDRPPTIWQDWSLAHNLPHLTYDHAQLILVAGKRGYGKTTFAREYLKLREPRVLALDPFGDFSMPCVDEDRAFEDLRHRAARRSICPPINRTSRDWATDFFERCIDELRDCLLVLDEITLWSQVYTAGSPLEVIVLQGRRLGIRLIVISQKIALVPDVMKTEATDLVLFRTTRPTDLETAAKWTSPQVARRLRDLGMGECIHEEA